MSSHPCLRVGVVGCGPVGAMHAAAVWNSPVARLVGVSDLEIGRAQSLAGRFGQDVIPRHGLADLLEHDSLDVVTVATPDHQHVEVALEAIAAGCHVFCEKPLATNSVDARRMVDAAASGGVALGVDHNRRFGFGYQRARALIDEGKLGSVGHLVFHVLDRTPPPEVARFPEVILTTLLTHHLDLARWFGGEVSRISARFGPPDRSLGGLRRHVALGLEFAGGGLGLIVSGYRDQQARTSEHARIVGSLGVSRDRRRDSIRHLLVNRPRPTRGLHT